MITKEEPNPDTKLWFVGAVGKCMSSPLSYAEHGRTYGKRGPKDTATFALQQLEQARAADVAAHEKNHDRLAQNASVRENVAASMKAALVPDTYRVRDLASRSRYQKHKTVTAGWILDLNRFAPIDDGFEAYAAKADELEAEAQRAREAAAAAEREKRRADLELAKIILRYSLPDDSTWSSVLDALRARDQRLDLAVAMAQTRGDWSDGAYRVASALERFTIETNEDKDIAASVAPQLSDFEDGRCFRDCNWNYDRLFASVADQQLSADVQKALENRDE